MRCNHATSALLTTRTHSRESRRQSWQLIADKGRHCTVSVGCHRFCRPEGLFTGSANTLLNCAGLSRQDTDCSRPARRRPGRGRVAVMHVVVAGGVQEDFCQWSGSRLARWAAQTCMSSSCWFATAVRIARVRSLRVRCSRPVTGPVVSPSSSGDEVVERCSECANAGDAPVDVRVTEHRATHPQPCLVRGLPLA